MFTQKSWVEFKSRLLITLFIHKERKKERKKEKAKLSPEQAVEANRIAEC
jgi:hypothetical protein